MTYLNLRISQLHSPEYIGSSPTERATWLNVLAYGAEQECGGTLKQAACWKDRQWQQTCGVTLREVKLTTRLLKIEGEDVTIFAYPVEKEREVIARREQAADAARIRWCYASRNASRNASRIADRDASRNAEENGMEGEGEGEGEMEGKEDISSPSPAVRIRFQKPTKEEVEAEASVIFLPALEAEKFWLFYESKGWVVGKSPMKSWKHALAGWKSRWQEQRERQNSHPPVRGHIAQPRGRL